VSEAITTSTAPNNPTPPGPLTQRQAEPTRHDGSHQPQGVISDHAYDALPEQERDRYSRVRKGPDGGSEWRERKTLQSETDPATKAATADTSSTAPSVTDDGRLKVGELLLSDQDIRGLMERHALEQGRKATMPATAAEYSLDLPADFVLPEGQNFKWATDHPVQGPLIGQAKEFAHAHGLDQAAFSKMMGLYAASQVHEAQMIANAQAAEREKLGPNIAHRVDAISNFIRGTVGDDKISKGLTQRILTADDVVGWERILRKSSSQGVMSFRQDGREPGGQPGRVSEEAYNKMTAAERWDYARGFDQKQFQNGAAR
jgi:hypothetical protein